ncbi:MAG: hypothetical protein AAF725_13770 [Acidobacteriota bacterium]
MLPASAQSQEICTPQGPEFFSSGLFESVDAISTSSVLAGQAGSLASFDLARGTVRDRVVLGFDINDIQILGNVAYLAMSITPQSGGNFVGELRLVDISDPDDLRLLGSIRTQGRADRLSVVGDRAYVTGLTEPSRPPGVAQIFDVSNPAQPVELASFATETRNIRVDGDTAYVLTAQNGLRVYDVSDPAQIIEIGSHVSADPSDDVKGLFVGGTRAYYATEEGVVALDVTNPAQPMKIGFRSLSFIDHLAARGDRLYADGVVLDASQLPDLPRVDVGALQLSVLSDVTLVGDQLFLGGDVLAAFDVSDPDARLEVALISRAQGESIYVKDNTLYLAGDHRLSIYDLEEDGGLRSLAALPDFFRASLASGAPEATLLSTTSSSTMRETVLSVLERVPGTDSISISPSQPFGLLSGSIERVGDLVLVVGSEQGSPMTLDLLDMSDPSLIEVGGALSFPPAQSFLPSTGFEADLAFVNSGFTIQAVDVSDFLAPVEIGTAFPAPENSSALALRGNALYLGGSRVYVVDVTDPASPALVGGLSEQTAVSRIWIDGSRLYAHGFESLLVYDITSPLNPVLLFSTPAETDRWKLVRRVTGPEGDRLVALRSSGLYAFGSCGVFADDFETGNTGAWSGVEP